VPSISLPPPQTPSLGLPSLPNVKVAVPVYYEEETKEDDDIDPSLYVLLDPEHGAPVFSDSVALVEGLCCYYCQQLFLSFPIVPSGS